MARISRIDSILSSAKVAKVEDLGCSRIAIFGAAYRYRVDGCTELLWVPVPLLSLHLTEHHPLSPADGSKKLVGLRNGSPSLRLRPKLVGFPRRLLRDRRKDLELRWVSPGIVCSRAPTRGGSIHFLSDFFLPCTGFLSLYLTEHHPSSPANESKKLVGFPKRLSPPSSPAKACGFTKRWLRDRFADLELRWVSPDVVCSRAPTRGGSTRFLSDLFLPCIGFLSLHLTEHHSPTDGSKKLVVCETALPPFIFGRSLCCNRLKVLKRLYMLYDKLTNLSGLGWDTVNNIPTAGNATEWDAVIAANPVYAKCRNKPFPAYNSIAFLCGSTVATGHYGMSSETMQPPTVVSSSSSSPGEASTGGNETGG
uniref:Myb/SANT-like domain-containing protein n=1 Tax=Ananas comosus var. bracteatus TaxID=296719 RepID=A0A6V7QLY5_ANACO|nr:unnamed protein product [Ananas comosus var. bracteatus]